MGGWVAGCLEGQVCQGQKRVPANYRSCQYAVVIPCTEKHSTGLPVPAQSDIDANHLKKM